MFELKPAREWVLCVGVVVLALVVLVAAAWSGMGPAGLFSVAVALFSTAVAGSLLYRNAMYRREARARVAAEQELRKLSWALEQSPICVLVVDRQGRAEYVNPRYCEVLGYRREQLLGRLVTDLRSVHIDPGQLQEIQTAMDRGQVWRGEGQFLGRQHRLHHTLTTVSPILDADGERTHVLVLHEDISDRVAYREHLFRQANFDALTGLPNRALALDRLAQAINGAERHGRSLTLMCLDLNRFKVINESLGHQHGDRLLVEAAERLRRCVREEDTVARLGSDEFLLILVNQRRDGDGSVVAEKIIDSLQAPLCLDERDITITASIGLTVFPSDGETPAELLRNAEAAMYMAKEQGENAYHFYTPEMNRRAVERLALESQLRQALTRGELSLHYQPVVDLGGNHCVAVEALMRWHNAELGEVGPDRFIPVAEETGLIIPLGQWLLSEACGQGERWRAQGWPLRVAVNVSSRQFVGGHIVSAVERALRESELPPQLLELELTERLLLSDAPQTKCALQQLKRLGVRLVLDDFGTGYSSLSYLKRYPFDALKIDRSFIRDLDREPETAALTRAIIAMGHSLGLEVVGEGIETEEQAQFLRHHGCRLAQGFFFGRPQPASKLELRLADFAVRAH